mgnify:CR=1 FL=1
MKQDELDLRQALDYIDPRELSYSEWVGVGMGLKEAGYPVGLWEDWSRRDGGRYRTGECARKWDSFRGTDTPITAGTLVQMAQRGGWQPNGGDCELGWDDEIGGNEPYRVIDPHWVEAQEIAEPAEWHPAQQLITYLETLFDSEKHVGYVTRSFSNEDGKAMPTKGDWARTAGQLVQALSACGDDIGSVLGDYDPAVGAGIRFNPLDGKGIRNENVTAFRYALIECDEAAFRKTSEYLPVECLVVNNIFRDQLDRYGEITHTLNAIREGITHVPNATLCLNADCSLTASLADSVPNKIVWFGVNVPIYKETAHELSDAPYCIHCKTEYEYDYITYGHLGGFRCPKCGYHRQTPQVAVTKVLATGADSSDIVLDIFGHEHEVHVNLPGGYNIYNAAAEAAVAHVVGIEEQTAVSALSQFECGFGRAEQFKLGQAQARMMLVKNPAGFNQVINLIAHDEGNYKLAFLLNDRFADGTDISWIWDVDFEALADQQVRFTRVLVSGVRADDMALRLKYAGFDPERIEVIREYDRLLTEIGSDETPAFLMPTYTAMFDLRGEISKHTDVKAFYE